MTTGATGQLGLALPVQGELSGTWGDTVNNGITQYTNIAIAGTLTLTGDGAVTLANTTGDASASNITSTLAGAGTVTAQFAIVKVSGTTTTKVVTGPSYSKTYVVDNASSYAVTFKASGQTGVSVAAAEKVTVVFNGTDYIKLAGTIANAAGSNTQIQFNNGGLFGASANLTWDGTTLSSTQVNITGQGTLRLQDTTGGEYVGLRAPASLGASYTLTWPADDGILGQALITDGSGALSWSTSASGDVYGPASATANGIALFDGTTGKLLKDSASTDGLIHGLTVGRGAGGVSTNTAVGASALAANTTGADNTALGLNALASNTTASENTAVGWRAGLSNTTGSNSTAVGGNAMAGNTTGSFNVAVGNVALFTNSTGSYNTAIGRDALRFNTTASNNTAVGYQAGYANTTGTTNTFLGYQSGYANTTGSNSTMLGTYAGYSNTGSGTNAFIGAYSGYNTTGASNTFVGISAGEAVTSGGKNTILGRYNGNQNSLDIRTASNYIVLSDGDGNPRLWHDGSGTLTLKPNASTTNIGYGFDNAEFYPFPDNNQSLGLSSFRWTTVYATTGTINTSDETTKQQIRSLNDAEKNVAQAIKGLIKAYKFNDAVAKKGDGARIHIGAIAQEVQAAFVAEGLDPNRYAMFCSDTWYEVDGKPSETAIEPFTAETPNAVAVTRLGLRYEELLAFVISTL
jgi:hypothetical protein